MLLMKICQKKHSPHFMYLICSCSSNIVKKGFKKYVELISCLLIDEQMNLIVAMIVDIAIAVDMAVVEIIVVQIPTRSRERLIRTIKGKLVGIINMLKIHIIIVMEKVIGHVPVVCLNI